MIATLIFLAVVIIAALVICWAIGALAGAFAPSAPSLPVGRIAVVLQVLVVLVALAYVLQHFGVG